MKLATFLHDGVERWGVVLRDSPTDRDVLVEPAAAAADLAWSISSTSGYSASRPPFAADDWPDTLPAFLGLGDAGMRELERFVRFLERFVEQSDEAFLARVGHPFDEVELLAPIPRPRLCWGLVTNSPSFARNNPGIRHINLFPLGHQRPQGSVVGAGAPVLMKHGHHDPAMSYNVELGVVIGTGGRYIPIERAMEHVAGYTTINDVAGNHYYGRVPGNEGRRYLLPPGYEDWFVQATASWGGKIADTLCPMGPYLVTKDEIGDPYDLLVHTRQDGRTRNRAHTSATILGIERVIAWYSSFARLEPGDVLHFGTMGIDGLVIERDVLETRGAELEVEIEDVGVLRNPVQIVPPGERVPFDRHPSYAVRAAALEPPLERDAWRVDRARHVFTAFGNHDRADEEGLPRIAIPRFLTGPASALAASGARVEIPPRATELEIGIELAAVVARLAAEVDEDEAGTLVLGLTPMLSVCDRSLEEDAIEPARPGERHIPAVYGRWADGFNIVLDRPAPVVDDWRGRRMTVAVDGREVTASTSDYLVGVAELLASISPVTTLFPGDVITLGRTTARLLVPATGPVRITGAIDGLGDVHAELVPAPARA